MKKVCAVISICLFLCGCATSAPIRNYLPVRNVKNLLASEIEINKSEEIGPLKIVKGEKAVQDYYNIGRHFMVFQKEI